MQETSLEKIEKTARELAGLGSKWHFHILTPGCDFNDTARYAFILEDLTNKQIYVHHSDQAEKGLGEKLVRLLHGDKILDQESVSKIYRPSATVQRISARAQELNRQGVEWHHHLFFPGCRFNQNNPRYTLVFEDRPNREVLQSITDTEPVNDLKQIEKHLYARK